MRRRTDQYLIGVTGGEDIQNVAEAIFEKGNGQEVSGIDKMHRYTYLRGFMNPKQIFKVHARYCMVKMQNTKGKSIS